MNKSAEKKEIDLLDFWHIAIKRKWVIIICAIVILFAAVIYSYTRVPFFRATATIMIQEPSSNMLNINDMINPASYFQYDFMGIYFNTQLRLLTSRSLAERVARRMGLSDRPELQVTEKPKKSLVQRVKDFVTLRWLTLSKKTEDEEEGKTEFLQDYDPNTMYAFTVMGGLEILPIPETRLVAVNYVSPHATLSADIVNNLIEEFINYSVEMRYEATQQASEFLSEQIAQLRHELSEKEREIQKYGEEKRLLYLDDRESTVVSKFSDLNSAFTEAQIARINNEAAYRELQGLNIDSMPQYVNNPLIQNLKTEYTQILNEYNEKIKVYKPDYPDMVRIKARLDSMKSQLQEEIQKAVDAARSEYRAALKREESLQQVLEEQRSSVFNMNNNAILYNSLRIEVENKRNLLNSLVARQNETLVSARLRGLKSSNIKIIDRALIPGAPFSPNRKRNMMIGLILGLFMGVGAAFLIEYLDNTIKGPEDAEKLVKLPSLGIIPYIARDGARRKTDNQLGYVYSYGKEDIKEENPLPVIKEIELINHLYPNLSVSEDYRTIRTSILFSHPEKAPQIICVSSSFPQEGKTATTTNTAVAFSQLEKKVLVIDGDMRKPRIHKVFNLRNIRGLSSYLTGKADLDEAIQKTSIDNLRIISSGPNPPNPAELLESRKMRELMLILREWFDVVLIDAPPVTAVIDPVIISDMSDGTVVVVRSGKTTRKALVHTVEELRKSKSPIIGIVFNEVKIRTGGYYSADHQRYLNGYYTS